jgi:hypothetical protein
MPIVYVYLGSTNFQPANVSLSGQDDDADNMKAPHCGSGQISSLNSRQRREDEGGGEHTAHQPTDRPTDGLLFVKTDGVLFAGHFLSLLPSCAGCSSSSSEERREGSGAPPHCIEGASPKRRVAGGADIYLHRRNKGPLPQLSGLERG